MTKNFIHELIGDETAEDSEPFRYIRLGIVKMYSKSIHFFQNPNNALGSITRLRSASPESPLLLESSVTEAVRSNVDLHNLYDNIDGVNENDVVQVSVTIAIGSI